MLLLFVAQIDEPYVKIGIILALNSVNRSCMDGNSKEHEEQTFLIAKRAARAFDILLWMAAVKRPFC